MMIAAALLAVAYTGQDEYPRPRPPSLPPDLLPASQLGGALDQRRTASTSNYTHAWSEGFIGSGGDVQPPQVMALTAALALCNEIPACRGITYKGDNDTKSAVNCYFKNNAVRHCHSQKKPCFYPKAHKYGVQSHAIMRLDGSLIPPCYIAARAGRREDGGLVNVAQAGASAPARADSRRRRNVQPTTGLARRHLHDPELHSGRRVMVFHTPTQRRVSSPAVCASG